MAPDVIAHYRITSKIGEGGMGAVYRATDTKLKRSVAIKILPPSVASDTDRLARLQREAEVLASLNHPHIAAIYGIEDANPSTGSGQAGVRALVMELVEGDDLSQRIARGAIPFDEAVPIAKQIADALEAAHERGIIHCDLKPANIKVRDDGMVKVLDFGLAKAMAPEGAGAEEAMNSPTLTGRATQIGMILGTAAYMAPEQAKGKAVDKRADIWAFGVVLHEMLTGRRLFDAEDISETLAAVLTRDVSMTSLPAEIPPRLRALLRDCLIRDPRQRLRDIGDARIALDRILTDAPQESAPSRAPVSRVRAMLPWAIAALALAGAGVVWATRPVRQTDRPLQVLQVDQGPTISSPQISPDGSAVAYIRNGRVTVRRLSDLEAREIGGTDDATNPFWSADSRSIGYITQNPVQVRMVTVADGKSRVFVSGQKGVTAFPPAGGTTCGADVVFAAYNQGLFSVAEGQTPRPIAPIDATQGDVRWTSSSCLPDGRILTVLISGGKHKLTVLEGSRRTTLLELDEPFVFPAYAPGFVVFQRGVEVVRSPNAGVWALPVSRDLSTATGPPIMIVPDGARPSVSANGLLVARTGLHRTDRQLVWTDRAGVRVGSLGRPQLRFRDPVISPDGSRVAVAAQRPVGLRQTSPVPGVPDTSLALWLYFESSVREWFPGEANRGSPTWSPDGKSLAYTEAGRVMVRPVDGAGEARELVARASPIGLSWTPDGRHIVYTAQGQSQRATSLMIVGVNPPSAPRTLIADGGYPAVSPDGTLLAYTAFALDRDEVFITTFPETGRVWPVSVGGGRRPRWNPKGGELFFTGGPRVGDDPNSHRDLFVARIDIKGGVKVSPPERLFDATAKGLEITNTNFRGYDVAPDGQRLIVQTSGLEGVPAVTVFDTLDAVLRIKK